MNFSPSVEKHFIKIMDVRMLVIFEVTLIFL
jgi:hypothetical protein